MDDLNSDRVRYDNKNMKDNSSELSIECDVEPFSLFSDNLSPIPASVVPRKLDFSNIDGEDDARGASPTPAPLSPPYKRVRALKLFDSPQTPKTILEKCSTPSHHLSRSRLLASRLAVPVVCVANDTWSQNDDSALGSLPPGELEDTSPGAAHHHRHLAANINPFTPDGQLLNKKKRALSNTPTTSTPEQPAKRLRESNISRYSVEFVELCVIGSGEFGRVSKCLNKLDGCVYAVKRSLRPVAGSAAERAALTEVYAHAALGRHPHVVRYYSAWAEDDHMLIQSEYCAGGSLAALLADGALPEPEVARVAAHVAAGLRYMHAHSLVHMDVKPANVFVCQEEEGAVYKLGDLGHVTCLSAPHVEEGDCRYLPREVLREDHSDLTKADVFALGLTLYEACGGGPLPKNGPRWHQYREGRLPRPPAASRELHRLLLAMTAPRAALRPTAAALLHHTLLQAPGTESRQQLRRELAAANLKNELLNKKLQEAVRYIKSLSGGGGAVGGASVAGSGGVRRTRSRHSVGGGGGGVNVSAGGGGGGSAGAKGGRTRRARDT